MTPTPTIPRSVSSTSSGAGAALGRTEPRLWTRPLRTLTPDTSFGFDVIHFAEHVLRLVLRPWQRWLLIHACELLPDGRPRFRQVLVEVGRQNGKTFVPVLLAAYWLFVERVPLVLGTSTTLDYAREPMDKMIAIVEDNPVLRRRIVANWVRRTNSQHRATLRRRRGELTGPRYQIAAKGPRAGRSLTVHRLVSDELREHRDYVTWDASYNAMADVPDGQAWCLSNAGSASSVVLNDMRDLGIEGADELGYFGWTSPAAADVRDVEALLQSNPSVGYGGIRLETLLAEAEAALRVGGEKLAGFRTEKMCITVPTLNPAIDPGAWARCADPGTLDDVRDRVALLVDGAPDGLHATLVAAAVIPDGRVRVEPVEAWAGLGAMDQARRAIRGIVARVKPRAFGWMPGGPGAELAADMARVPGWPPRGVELVEVRGDAAAACMALRSLVIAGQIAHSNDPLVDAHIAGAERLDRGDTWVFARRGRGHCDAAYAVAGAVQIARSLPPPVARRGLVVVDG
jgi:hypothetical protein